eukprot:4908495-Pleurochrysis_carterae.AAC.1
MLVTPILSLLAALLLFPVAVQVIRIQLESFLSSLAFILPLSFLFVHEAMLQRRLRVRAGAL